MTTEKVLIEREIENQTKFEKSPYKEKDFKFVRVLGNNLWTKVE